MSAIFVSFSNCDSNFTENLTWELEKNNYKVIKDVVKPPITSPIIKRIFSKSYSVDYIILVISRDSERGTSIASDWKDLITDEVIHGRNWLIPILISDCNLPEYLTLNNVEDFRSSQDYNQSLNKLLNKILTIRRL